MSQTTLWVNEAATLSYKPKPAGGSFPTSPPPSQLSLAAAAQERTEQSMVSIVALPAGGALWTGVVVRGLGCSGGSGGARPSLSPLALPAFCTTRLPQMGRTGTYPSIRLRLSRVAVFSAGSPAFPQSSPCSRVRFWASTTEPPLHRGDSGRLRLPSC